MQEFFPTGTPLKQVNATLITLIPKTDWSEDASQSRPISCCNTINKCISKILCTRLKDVLHSLVEDTQAASVTGRYLAQNVLICHDLYNSELFDKNCLVEGIWHGPMGL